LEINFTGIFKVKLCVKIYLYILLILTAGYVNILSQTYLDPTKSINERAEDLLARMTLDEKIGQMTQAGRSFLNSNNDISKYFLGSLLSGGGSAPSNNSASGWAQMYDEYQSIALTTRLKIPMIYGIDAVHGHNNVKGAVIFPHNIGLGATNNPELVKRAAEITALEVAATGIDWTFAPCIAVPRDERWGRTYEGFAETPELTSIMSAAAVSGLQGDLLSNPASILACAKHFIGDGGTAQGSDQGNTQLSEDELRAIHLPGYLAAIENNVGSIMASYNSWNGEKLHGQKYLMTDLLKTELGFEGFIVSDWAAIDQLPGDYKGDIEKSINAGIDMVMVPGKYAEFINLFKELVNEGKINDNRINDAVLRILKIKFKLGLFENPYSDISLLGSFGNQDHRDVARQCVRESLVLLKKKDDILPLKKDGSKILVAGKAANDIGTQCGGWTISWQGMNGDITEGTTIFEALQITALSSTVTYSENGDVPSDADAAVVVIGEAPYAEGNGDRTDLHFSDEDVNLIRKVKESGKPVIVIMLSGRPMIIDNIVPYSDVLIAAWLPGTEALGITDVLFGDYQPKGKLPHSWPKSMYQIPINFGDEIYDPLFEYQFGINSSGNTPSGSAPEFYSGLILDAGLSLEISFTKDINDLTVSKNDFSVLTNNNELEISNIQMNPNGKKSIIFNVNSPINKGDVVNLFYNQGSLQSYDGGFLNTFETDQIYNLLNETTAAVTIPAKIEAEDYTDMNGIQTENTLDEGGGINVGWIDDGDWMDYNINVPSPGSYIVNYRIASPNTGGKLNFINNGSVLSSANIPVTGNWQFWQTVQTLVNLNFGEQTIRLFAEKGGFNLNWFSFDAVTDIEETKNITPNFSLEQNYPNPFNGSTIIKFSIPEKDFVNLKIFDMLGREIKTLISSNLDSGNYTFELNAANMTSGVYFYYLTNSKYVSVKKFILLK